MYINYTKKKKKNMYIKFNVALKIFLLEQIHTIYLKEEGQPKA